MDHNVDGDMHLECKSGDLLSKGDAWIKIRDAIQQRVCGALNSLHDGDEETAQSEWTLQIDLKNKEHPEGYAQALAERIEDKLNNMIQKSRLSQAFALDESKDHLTLRIRQNASGVATLDFKSPEATEKGLVAISADRFCFFMFVSSQEEDGNPPRSDDTLARAEELKKPLKNNATITIQESPYLQCKSLEPRKTRQNIKKAGDKVEEFSPKSGNDVVDWLWDKSTRTVGEYVAAFAKNKGKGGFFYCGLEEQKTTITIEGKKKSLTTGYIVKALELQDDWKKDVETGLQRKIREDMLWVKSNPSEGYDVLKPDEVKEDQVKINFIKVEGKAKKDFHFYILEVEVSPFSGVVFNDKNGPEAYELQKTQGSHEYTPVRMKKEDWFQKMSDFGWCSKHSVPKDMKCGTSSVCTDCLHVSEEMTLCINCKDIEVLDTCEPCKLSARRRLLEQEERKQSEVDERVGGEGEGPIGAEQQ